ncbi:enoyl-CoA hydratase-related protein [Quadrisphaera setariae]|uniref:Enoyl-CoA hydratase n=1 Tax=Quadrisphaera setariae TaxID=2593304 RepID=A0A5C8ZE28_9ACTN|nr:enoyl-CoA hydratase-related protein [Quadrisphaera setariae]TXR55549.1 enoyl-CoA hydratase [Quadrisphaera setariae]
MSTEGGAGAVLLERKGGLARLVISNPAARGAFTEAMYAQLRDHCLALRQDASVRLVSVTGRDGAFAAGTDVADLVEIRTGEDGVAYERHVVEVLDAVRALRVPVLALVDGPAVGGGLAVVACCDVVVATPASRFGAPVARTLGNCVSPGTTARLRASLGRALTSELLLTGRLATAEEVRAAGLVSRVVEPSELVAVEAELLAAVSRCAPHAVAAAKEIGARLDDAAVVGAGGWPVDADDVYAAVYSHPDFHEGVAAFLEHRRPRWSTP